MDCLSSKQTFHLLLHNSYPQNSKDGRNENCPNLVFGSNRDQASLLEFLKLCGKHKNIQEGSRIHENIIQRGLFREDLYLNTAVVSMYAKCGAFAKARRVLDEIPFRTVVSWNALIGGYVQHGLGNEALNCFERMQDEGISPDVVTFASIVKACASMRSTRKGVEVHAEVSKGVFLAKNVMLATSLVDMYAKSGDLAKAQKVFDDISIRDVVSWTALISGYVQHGLADKALDCLVQMKDEGISPNAVTFTCLLKACSITKSANMGEEIHAEILKQGLMRKNIKLATALVDMYAKCGFLTRAQEVFDSLIVKDAVSWTALISGYAEHAESNKAVDLLKEMRDEGHIPDAYTFSCVLKACGCGVKGEEIHAEVVRLGLFPKDTALGNALVHMYVRNCMLGKAQEVFDKIPAPDVVTWTSMIAGYVQQGLNEEALNCFGRMGEEDVPADAATFTCVLKACANMGSADKGEDIFAEVRKLGLLGKDIMLGHALIDMYSKCGMLERADEVFNELPERDVNIWTVLITGYALLGEVEKVFALFGQMVADGIVPDRIIFVVMLSACNHVGLVEDGQMYFDAMSSVYSLTPDLEHYSCMVDLFSRAGHFEKAISMVEKVRPEYRFRLWSVLLGACRKWRKVELGKWVFEQSIRLEVDNAAAYICMRDIYADAGMQGEVDKINALRINTDGHWNTLNQGVD